MGIILGNFHTAFPEITSILNTVTSMTIHHIYDWLLGLWPLTTCKVIWVLGVCVWD